MRISLRQVHAFQEVAKAGSFTIASQNMHLTQSAVSMLVRQLELELDLKLFDRVNRSAKLTEVGAQLLPTAERVLSDMRNMVDGAADLKALNRGTLRISTPQMLACSWLPPMLGKYRELYPGIEINVADVTGDEVVTSVANNLSEIGIGPERTTPTSVKSQGLWVEQMQIVLPKSSTIATAKDGLTVADIQNHPWINYSDEFNLYFQRTVWTQTPQSQALQLRVNSLTTALAMVSAGHGLTAAPQYANIFEQQFDVAFRPLLGRDTGRLFCLYQRSGNSLSPAAARFVELVQETLNAQQ